MLRKLLSFIRANDLLRAGDRLGLAVSGGADSVALLRAMLELRKDLGVVLSVVHVHHGIRREADADAEFVSTLADQYSLDLHLHRADVPTRARESRLSLEAAGREVRYEYFSQLMSSSALDRVATAHTFDDQAETVLLRLIRGAGLQGLAGIYKKRALGEHGDVIRPMLGITRAEVLEYLRSLGQQWREDATNADVTLARNRVRHELLPLLVQNYNPGTRQALSNLAEIAFADSDYLSREAAAVFSEICDEELSEVCVDALLKLPIALQRQVLISAAEQFLDQTLEFAEIEDLRRLLVGDINARQLNHAHRVERIRKGNGHVLRFVSAPMALKPNADYEYSLPVPGEVYVAELCSVIRVRLVDLNAGHERYNPADLLDPARLLSPLTLRNVRPGDRFHPLHTKAPEKLKRLFLERKIPQHQRPSWPVVVSGNDLVWVRGFAAATGYVTSSESKSAVVVEQVAKR